MKIEKITVETTNVNINGVVFTAFVNKEEFQKLLNQVGAIVEAVNKLESLAQKEGKA